MTDQPYEGPYEGPYQGPYEGQQYQRRQQYQGEPHGQQQYQGQQYGQQQYGQQPQGYDPQGYDPQGYDPYWQQAHEDPQAAQQYTQQWQGQTWETQVHQPVSAAETAYLPQQGPAEQAYPAAQQPQAPGVQAHAHAQGQAQAQASASAAEEPASGFGPATVAGNARVTDAQWARQEGRSPIIEPGMQPAALTALLGLLLSGTAAVGSYALVVPLVVLQAVTAAGWFRLNGMWPARQGIALAFLGALVADAALLVAGRENGPAAILGTLGVWVLLSLVLQLRSHAPADERMYGLMATVASAALSIVAAGHLAAEPDAVTVGAAAVAVAVLARALPLPTPASVVVALLAAAGAGIAVGQMTGLGAKGALLGAGAAVCALIGHRVASYDYPSRFVHFTAGVALPLAAAAPAVYLLGRALG
ncbi:Peptidase C83 domain-containing protein OS=Streptomyces alboniger OX=132473 GN=CP975_16400 PE=4 SV=1 [Streptomyces alboniger]